MSNDNPPEGSGYLNPPHQEHQQPYYQTYNNQSFYNSYYQGYNHQPQPSSSNSFSRPVESVPNIGTSRLTPTAQEFTPRNETNQNTGAVKKKTYNDRNKHWENKRHYKQNFPNRKQAYFNRNKPENRYQEEPVPDLTLHNSGTTLKNSKKQDYKNNLTDDFNKLSLNAQYSKATNENLAEQASSDEVKYSSVQQVRNQNDEYSTSTSRGSKKYENGRNYYSRDNQNDEHSNSGSRGSKKYENDRSSSYRNSYRDNNKGGNSYYENRYSHRQHNRYDKSDSKYYDRNEKNRENNRNNNWRGSSSRDSYKKNQQMSEQDRKKKMDAASQRERLVEMLETRMLECLVCCEKVKNNDKIWSCKQCYHILHLNCTASWAKLSKLEAGWRCPACQNVCSEFPSQYKCYCGKVNDPKSEPGVMPHSCGDVCLKKGRICEHKCLILCHPGPCPDCNVMIEKNCGCGATHQTVKCSSDVDIICEADCNKLLECTQHKCTDKCHLGPCKPCNQLIKQECFCGKVGRYMLCTSEYRGVTKYECDDVCGKELSCGNHKCDKLCHDGPCDICPRDVSLIKTCPCGKKKLSESRKSCLDPIPSCKMTCGKFLKCGQPSAPHSCKIDCHEGECPPCPLTTLVRCRCGHMDKELPCQTLTTKADDARCEKKCTKKRLCGKHKCNQRCCIEIEHICPLPCNHQLSCGQHRCDKTCHSGRCPPCIEASFEELYCECGAAVLYPPIPCGTKPPLCSNPCTRSRLCGHPPNHNCHTGPCPPCTVLCKRWCYGKHEERSAIPCHQENFSCGLPCGKQMPCGRHKCVKPCHLGDCPLPCKQPCTIERPLCGHPCNAPCHNPPCPETSCKQNVPVTCSCGLLKTSRPCTELAEEFRNIEMAQLKDKMVEKDQPFDISDILSKPKKPAVLKILECNEECKVFERNKRLAIGLQIRNPDLTQKLTPRYSDFMRQWAKKDPHFCQRIHNKLTDLVQLAKQSKQKSRAFSFESMNRDKRHFVHEYCEHFGCESAAYDSEPNRNVVATAFKDKSWLPSMSLLDVIQRENGHRKVPGPIMTKGTPGKSESVTLKLTSRSQRPATPPGEYVDYFDDPLL